MNTPEVKSLARLLITCPDKPGIVYKVSEFFAKLGANITALDQHSTCPENGTFFMRLEFQTSHIEMSDEQLEEQFAKQVANQFNMQWQLRYAEEFKKMALLVSREDHAMLELLWRWQRGELPLDIPLIISNHPDLAKHAQNFNIPFYHIPNNQDIRKTAEDEMLAILKNKADGLILARYMQILSKEFISHYENQVINIHHSFLPAFKGANPYQQAFDNGVKLIGATAHFVTEDLDMGPIISQDVVRVTHRLNLAQFKELGKNVERNVLARALKCFAEDRIIVYGNKTIVFEEH